MYYFSLIICSGLTLIVAHGLCSSGIFCLANITYGCLFSRSSLLNNGMINYIPSLSLWWLILSITNMASPPSINLLSEISLLNSIIVWSYFSFIGASPFSFLSAAYTWYLYSYNQHRIYYSGIFPCWSSNIREYLLLFCDLFPLNFIIAFGLQCFIEFNLFK